MALGKSAKLVLGVVGVIIGLLGLLYVHMFVYPFVASEPNFADVERVFNRMQFPSEWQEIRTSENRGLHGRACPIESESACFHKSKTFHVPQSIENPDIEMILQRTGCSTVQVTENNPIGGTPYNNYGCSVEGLDVRGQLDIRGEAKEVYIGVITP